MRAFCAHVCSQSYSGIDELGKRGGMIRKAHLGGSAIPWRACSGVYSGVALAKTEARRAMHRKTWIQSLKHTSHTRPPNSVLENARVWRTMGA